MKDSFRKPHVQIATALVVALFAATLGFYVQNSRASSGAVLSLTPATGSYATGDTVTVQVMVNTNGQPINAAQATLSYPSTRLQYQSIETTGSVLSIDAPSTGGNGTVSIARGNVQPFTGSGLVATVHFVVLSSGSATISFATSSAVARSTDNASILASTKGSKFNLRRPKGAYAQPSKAVKLTTTTGAVAAS